MLSESGLRVAMIYQLPEKTDGSQPCAREDVSCYTWKRPPCRAPPPLLPRLPSLCRVREDDTSAKV